MELLLKSCGLLEIIPSEVFSYRDKRYSSPISCSSRTGMASHLPAETPWVYEWGDRLPMFLNLP